MKTLAPEADWFNMFEPEEIDIINEAELRETQLRTIRKVMLTCTPKKLKRMEEHVLPLYIMNDINARNKMNNLMEKKGFTPK